LLLSFLEQGRKEDDGVRKDGRIRYRIERWDRERDTTFYMRKAGERV
jgi:hypothetical protein